MTHHASIAHYQKSKEKRRFVPHSASRQHQMSEDQSDRQSSSYRVQLVRVSQFRFKRRPLAKGLEALTRKHSSEARAISSTWRKHHISRTPAELQRMTHKAHRQQAPIVKPVFWNGGIGEFPQCFQISCV